MIRLARYLRKLYKHSKSYGMTKRRFVRMLWSRLVSLVTVGNTGF